MVAGNSGDCYANEPTMSEWQFAPQNRSPSPLQMGHKDPDALIKTQTPRVDLYQRLHAPNAKI